jgi:hypothetical protein
MILRWNFIRSKLHTVHAPRWKFIKRPVSVLSFFFPPLKSLLLPPQLITRARRGILNSLFFSIKGAKERWYMTRSPLRQLYCCTLQIEYHRSATDTDPITAKIIIYSEEANHPHDSCRVVPHHPVSNAFFKSRARSLDLVSSAP